MTNIHHIGHDNLAGRFNPHTRKSGADAGRAALTPATGETLREDRVEISHGRGNPYAYTYERGGTAGEQQAQTAGSANDNATPTAAGISGLDKLTITVTHNSADADYMFTFTDENGRVYSRDELAEMEKSMRITYARNIPGSNGTAVCYDLNSLERFAGIKAMDASAVISAPQFVMSQALINSYKAQVNDEQTNRDNAVLSFAATYDNVLQSLDKTAANYDEMVEVLNDAFVNFVGISNVFDKFSFQGLPSAALAQGFAENDKEFKAIFVNTFLSEYKNMGLAGAVDMTIQALRAQTETIGYKLGYNDYEYLLKNHGYVFAGETFYNMTNGDTLSDAAKEIVIEQFANYAANFEFTRPVTTLYMEELENLLKDKVENWQYIADYFYRGIFESYWSGASDKSESALQERTLMREIALKSAEELVKLFANADDGAKFLAFIKDEAANMELREKGYTVTRNHQPTPAYMILGDYGAIKPEMFAKFYGMDYNAIRSDPQEFTRFTQAIAANYKEWTRLLENEFNEEEQRIADVIDAVKNSVNNGNHNDLIKWDLNMLSIAIQGA